MAASVLIVDKSAAMRSRIIEGLEGAGVEIVSSLSSASMVVNLFKRRGEGRLDVDVLILDIDHVEQDVVKLVSEILGDSPKTRIILTSEVTDETAENIMECLSRGASDFIKKIDIAKDPDARQSFIMKLKNKVVSLTQGEYPKVVGVQGAVVREPRRPMTLRKEHLLHTPHALAIGCSTGGPQALNTLFSMLKGKVFHVPVFITQHMPAHFTSLLAKQITEVSDIPCKEAESGELVEAGQIYIAPGDYHMLVKKEKDGVFIHLTQTAPENFCRPSVDPMLRSLVEVYDEKLLVVILTGMGSDGLLGGRHVVEHGGQIIAQDEETSVVWGMPGAVAMDGLCTRVVPLTDMAKNIIQLSQGKIR